MNSLNQIREWMANKELDGIIISKRNNFAWLTGGKENYIANGKDEGVAALYITPQQQFVIAASIEMPRILDEEVGQLGYQPMEFPWYESWMLDTFPAIVKGQRIGTDSTLLAENFMDISPELSLLRSVLEPSQMEQYRSVGRLSAEAIEEVAHKLEPGWSEQEIRAEVARSAHRRGVNPTVILIATDERIFKYRHPIATDKKLDTYAMIVICGERYGLVANATRFVHFGSLSAELEEKSRKVAEIDANLIASTRPGVSYQDFFAKLQRLYAEAGYPDEWKLHHQGGPTGFAAREFLATPSTTGQIRLNQAFAWNPSITGTKSEDTILVMANGVDIITRTGNWPMHNVKLDGKEWARPAILIRNP